MNIPQRIVAATRAVIPETLKRPLRLVRHSGQQLICVPQSFYRKHAEPALQILSFKAKFGAAYVQNRGRAKLILTIPHKPEPGAVLYKICHVLGYRITDDPKKKADLVVNWEDCTFRRSDAVLESLGTHQPVLNIGCRDISKRRVETVHRAVFGYGLAVDPREFTGRCVKKSNANATHDGRIIQCPINVVDEEAIYQRVVNNSRDGVLVEDIRVPIFGKAIPFCYRVLRPMERRFGFGIDNISAEICEVSELLSVSEAAKLLRLCHELGLDYGELDVLRDTDEGNLYIVDANSTPFGPPKCMDRRSASLALRKLSEAFVASFGVKFSASC